MAENILGGGYVAPAKPFNVINPSGVSSESALNTLLAVGEGKRNRAHQARQSAASMEFQQREGERERMFQAEQTAGAQQFQEQQRRKGVESEEYFRTREERFSLMMRDQEDALSALDQEISLAVAQGQEGRAVELKKKQGEVRQQLDEVSPRIRKLTLLKAAYDGMFNKDFTNADGKSVGAQILKNLSTLGVEKANHFKNMQATLHGAVDRLRQGEGMKAALASVQKTKDKEAEAKGEASKAEKAQYEWVSPSGPGGAAQRVLKKGVTPAPVKSSWAETTPVEEVVKQVGGRWTDLSEAIAATASGNSDLSKNKVGVELMLNTLEQATAADPTQAEYYMQEAASQYKRLVEGGMDQDNLDKALYALSMKTATAGQGKAAIEGQAVVDAEGRATAPVGQVVASQDVELLSKMLDRFSRQQDVSPEGTRSRLLKGYGNSDFFDFHKGEAKGDFSKDILEVFTTLSGASDPEDLLRVLTDSDPENDPQGLKFVSQLHPEVRDVILKDLSQAARDLQALREREGIDVGTKNVSALPGLREQETDLTRQYNVDLPNEMSQASHQDFTGLRGKVSQGRKEVRSKREKDRNRIDDEMENARKKVLGD